MRLISYLLFNAYKIMICCIWTFAYIYIYVMYDKFKIIHLIK